jgi:hypothetical protein
MLWRSAAYIKDAELDEARGERDKQCMAALRMLLDFDQCSQPHTER